jgi:eukaryotic-like serine/threonine-protein kinase
MIGQILGNYRITKLLGEGGMGIVYQAEHVTIGRKVAIKLLLPMFSHHHEIVTRFFNEARATSIIEHPGLISVFDYGYHEDRAYIVMEYISGESLAARLARQPVLPQDLIVGLARQVAGALHAAHERGIVHRDLKPDNVMLVSDSDIPIGLRAKVLDFGIAKLAKLTIDPHAVTNSSGPDLMTCAGALLGTPEFMSPEQCRGAGEVDARSDIYALGCMLFVMATGRVPFSGAGNGDIMAAHIRDPIPPIEDPRLAPALVSIIHATLAKHPDQRPQTMTAVVALLDELSPMRERASPPGPHPTTAPGRLATTLGGSTGQFSTPQASGAGRRSSAKLIAIGAGVVSAAAIATVLVIARAPNPPPKVVNLADPGPALTAPPLVRHDAPSSVASPPPRASGAVVLRGLHVETTPSGATVVLVDDAGRREVGVTPADGEIPRHEVRIELSRVGFVTRTEIVRAGEGPAALSIALVPDRLKATIISAPAKAVVYDDTNRRRGVTPLRVELDRAGPARAYRIECVGYVAQVVQLSAKLLHASARLVRDRSVPPASECE